MLTCMLLLICLGLVVLLWRWCCPATPNRLPPQPLALPLIGHLYLASRVNLPKTYINLAKKYGDIFRFKLGLCELVIVTGYDKIVELKRKKAADFSGRARHFLKDGTENQGLLWSSGESWKRCKAITMRALKDMNKGGGIEKRVSREAGELKKALLTQVEAVAGTAEKSHVSGGVVDVRPLLANAVANIVASISLGNRFEYNDGEFQSLLHLMDDYTRYAAGNLVTAFPFLRFLPGDLFNYYKLVNFGRKLNDYTRQKIRTRLTSLQRLTMGGEGGGSGGEERGEKATTDRCMIDYYLADKLNDPDGDSALSEDNFAVLLKDLFLAGTETASNTVSWGLLLLAYDLPLQKALREEIRLSAGCGRLTMAALNRSQFVKAVIAELHRRAAVSAYGSPPIYMDQDSELGGYDIPAGTVLVTCLHTIHLNDSYYTDPLKFDPYRFLDEKGRFQKPERHMPFGAGPRSCPADFVGHMEVMLYLCHLIRSFTFTLVEGEETRSTQGVVGLTHTPPDFKLRVTPIADSSHSSDSESVSSTLGSDVSPEASETEASSDDKERRSEGRLESSLADRHSLPESVTAKEEVYTSACREKSC